MERKIGLHTSQAVYDQAKNWRPLFRREFLEMKIGVSTTERILQSCERKFKDFIADENKVAFHRSLSRSKYSAVKAFFKKHETHPEMVELSRNKRIHKGRRVSVQPEESDILIFSEALSLPNLYFVTTDGHFKVLAAELEKEFHIYVIHDENALGRMREWRWI